jgi:glycogen debranching enzyme
MMSPHKKKLIKEQFINQARYIFENNTFKGYSPTFQTRYKFIAPANVEYTYQWLWDTAFHAIVLSNFDTNWAKEEIRNYLKGQWEDGFMPHVVFWTINLGSLPHWAFIESKSGFKNFFKKSLTFRKATITPKTSAITQPPVLPIAVEEIYQKDQDLEFLKEVLPSLAKGIRWLLTNRDPDLDYLISLISPNESGMDELPVFQLVSGYSGTDSTKLRYYYRKPDLLNKKNYYNSKKILQKDYFNTEEVLFNTIFVEACRSLSRLFKEIKNLEEAAFFIEIALKSEKSLLEKCWNERENIFYSLYSKRELQTNIKTVASLMPLYLDGLEGEKLKLLVDEHLLNPEEFCTDYPIPSVAVDEPYFYPEDLGGNMISGTSLLWRGPTWINTNWFIVKGLRKHGYKDIADNIVEKMVEMVQREGFREFYNPLTGEGYRRDNFGWSSLILDLL